jgi:hypothetical protein
MMHARRLAVFALFVAASVLVGCKGDLSTPKGATKAFATAMEKGDAEAAKRASTGGNPAIVESMAKAMGSSKKLRDAAIAKFGDEGKKIMGEEHNDMAELAKTVDESEMKEDGDNATLKPKTGEPVKLKKINGEWKVDLTEMTAAMGTMGTGLFDSMSRAASETADDIQAGKYKTVLEAQQAFGAKMAAAPPGKAQ